MRFGERNKNRNINTYTRNKANLCEFHSLNFISYNMHTYKTQKSYCPVSCEFLAADHLLPGNNPTCNMLRPIRVFLFLFQQIELDSIHRNEFNRKQPPNTQVMSQSCSIRFVPEQFHKLVEM